MDYRATIQKQIEKLEEVQNKHNLSAGERCEIAKTIDYLVASMCKYEKFSTH